jgi:hypothetical protein
MLQEPMRASLIGTALVMVVLGSASAAEPDKQALIEDARSAASPAMRETATVVDEQGNVLRQGSGAYTCMPTPAALRAKGAEPMCADEVWMKFNDAWMNKKPFQTEKVGIGYMLAGDTGASNTEPFATGPTADNEWIQEGPHVMVIMPDPAQLEALPDDPVPDGAYVMWKGTPYAHIMVPVGPRPAQQAASK